MTAASGIDPIAAPLGANARDQRDPVRERRRIDPAARADKKRAGGLLRDDDPRREDDDRPGRYVDIEV